MTRLLAATALAALLTFVLPVSGTAAPRGRRPSRGALGTATGAVMTRERAMLGATLRLEAAGRPAVADTLVAARALDHAMEAATDLAGALDETGGTSELTRINALAADDRVACSPELFDALVLARALAEAVDGAWDPTAGALLPRAGRPEPAPGEATTLVGWRMLTLDPPTRTARLQRQGMALSLGPVGQGFVLDRLVAGLRADGVTRARLTLGDVTLAFTPREAWTVRVPDPDGRDALVLALSNAAAATASPLASPRVLDPRTGRPPRDLATVAVVAPSAALAAGLSRALLVRGREAAADYAGRHPEIGVLWLEAGSGAGGLRLWLWNLGRVDAVTDRPLERMTNP